jgi:carbamoyltransferase
MAATAGKLTGSRNLCLAGGVALNCVANAALLRAKLFENIWVQPAAGDAGGALGCALAVNHMYFAEKRTIVRGKPDAMNGSYLGPELSAPEVELMARKYKAVYFRHDDTRTLAEDAASRIDNGQVVGWVQGRMEWGPRSLGNRSILGDARDPGMQEKMNLKIKRRESFRPFAPAVLDEDAGKYFKLAAASPYMLLTAEVADDVRNRLPAGYEDLSIKDRLSFKGSAVPAVTHVDFSARPQTVRRENNPVFWLLLNAFKQKTGCGMVINTSFNVRGEPIVLTPEDAYRCFMRTGMDCLVLGGYVFEKTRQPAWKENRGREEGSAPDH